MLCWFILVVGRFLGCFGYFFFWGYGKCFWVILINVGYFGVGLLQVGWVFWLVFCLACFLVLVLL